MRGRRERMREENQIEGSQTNLQLSTLLFIALICLQRYIDDTSTHELKWGRREGREEGGGKERRGERRAEERREENQIEGSQTSLQISTLLLNAHLFLTITNPNCKKSTREKKEGKRGGGGII